MKEGSSLIYTIFFLFAVGMKLEWKMPSGNAVTPQLLPLPLPGLVFHDLVFGAELGRGTFATVYFVKRVRSAKDYSHTVFKVQELNGVGLFTADHEKFSAFTLASVCSQSFIVGSY